MIEEKGLRTHTTILAGFFLFYKKMRENFDFHKII